MREQQEHAQYASSKWDIVNRVLAILVVLPLMVVTASCIGGSMKGGTRVLFYLFPVVYIWRPSLNPRLYSPRWGVKDRHEFYTRIGGWLLLLFYGAITLLPVVLM